MAHRWFYEQANGPIPKDANGDSLTIDHLCHNPSCVNPDHLEPVTRTVNSRRRSVAKLTQSQAEEIRALKGTASQAEIGRRYGVSYATIGNIWRGETWRDDAG